MSKVKEAVTVYWGDRCPDHDPECPTCQAWDEYDNNLHYKRRNQMRELSTKFTEYEVELAVKLCEGAARLFTFTTGLSGVSMDTQAVSIGSVDAENDTLNLNGAYIQKVIEDVPAIVPRKAVRFEVSVPCMIRGMCDEPDYDDIRVIGTADSLIQAVQELVMYECSERYADVAQASVYEMDKELYEEGV